MNLLIMIMCVFMLFLAGGCYQDCGEGGCSEASAEEGDYGYYHGDDGIEEGSEEDPYAIEKSDEESDYLWTLAEMDAEQYECEDEFWNELDDTETFCKCRTEMLSKRWTYEDYRHHPFSYIERLNKNESIGRCLEPTELPLPPEDPEIIAEDQDWIPDEESVE